MVSANDLEEYAKKLEHQLNVANAMVQQTTGALGFVKDLISDIKSKTEGDNNDNSNSK